MWKLSAAHWIVSALRTIFCLVMNLVSFWNNVRQYHVMTTLRQTNVSLSGVQHRFKKYESLWYHSNYKNDLRGKIALSYRSQHWLSQKLTHLLCYQYWNSLSPSYAAFKKSVWCLSDEWWPKCGYMVDSNCNQVLVTGYIAIWFWKTILILKTF